MATKSIEERLIDEKVHEAREKIEGAKLYARESKEKFDTLVSEHPLAFVAGAFIGGLLIGKMLSNKE